MARTPYVKNYETWEDLPSEDTPCAAEQLQNYDDGIKGIDDDLRTVETNGIIGATQYGGTIVTNVNTITKNGYYTAYGDGTGVPTTGYSWFINHENSNVGVVSATQTAKAYVAGEPIIYVRNKISSTWGAWFLLPKRSEITNLDNVTKCITATAGSNGDFKINIPNSLVAGLEVNVILPTATVPTANSRFSIDNGITHKNVFINNMQSIAKSVMSRDVVLRYDGNQWQCINLEVYSLTEIKTNKIYRDGRPIYRGLLNFTSNSTLNSWVEIATIPNIDLIVLCSGCYVNGNEMWAYPREGQFFFYIDRSTGKFYNQISNSFYVGKQFNVTLEYVKGTD